MVFVGVNLSLDKETEETLEYGSFKDSVEEMIAFCRRRRDYGSPQ